MTTEEFDTLHKRAEKKLGFDSVDISGMTDEDIRIAFQELHIHQIELEMQNEELLLTQINLEKSRKSFSDLYDFAPVGYLTISEKGLILEANLTAANILCQARASLLKQPLSVFIIDEDQDIFYLKRKVLLETGQKQSYELRLQRKDGSIIHAQLETVFKSSKDCETGQFRMTISDISERNTELLEKEKLQSYVYQQEKLAAIGQLAAGVAHEINNPMGFISSNLNTLEKYVGKLSEFVNSQSEIIAAHPLFEEVQTLRKKMKIDYVIDDISDLIDESREGATRVSEIVQNLKKFSRVDEKKQKEVNLNDCLENTIKVIWNELKYKAELKREYGELPLIKCYPQQLNQIFMNLMINAAHAIEKVGEIKAKTWQENNTVFISIIDTGTGISAENINKIFDPFFTTKEVGKGTGLGLSISYEIIKNHGGEITVESEVGKGTTFTIKLPVV